MFETLFSERGLSLDRLRVLLEVRDAGGIAQAAPGDPVRQSQYSRQLRELAEFFGCEVARRSGRQIKLTPQGERLATLAREHLLALDDFRTECREEITAFTLGAGDSLIQWLVIPRLGKITETMPGTRFGTLNLRTNEIVQRLTEGQMDFGIIRKTASAPGLKTVSLGRVSYVALIPTTLTRPGQKPTLREALASLPLAAQTTDGEFAAGLRKLARLLGLPLAPALVSQSFPQALAAVKTGCFWAIVPALAAQTSPIADTYCLSGGPLRELEREAMLAWNQRLIRVRPHAAKLAGQLQHALSF